MVSEALRDIPVLIIKILKNGRIIYIYFLNVIQKLSEMKQNRKPTKNAIYSL